MRQNRFVGFRQHLKSWGISFLISLCLLIIFFIGIAPKEPPRLKKAQSLSDPNAFRQILSRVKPVLNLIAPEQLGVKHWQIGDYAQYQYHRYQGQPPPSSPLSPADAEKTVTFQIVGDLKTPTSRRYWMKTTGLLFFRHIPSDLYQLVHPNDIRMTAENRGYRFTKNYIPSKEAYGDPSHLPVVEYVKLGKATIETQAGHFECIHYRVELGPDFPTHEIWANAAVRPLGIVRVRSQNEVLELISFGQNRNITVPKLFQPVLQGISTLNHGCTSCHGSDNCHESISPPK